MNERKIIAYTMQLVTVPDTSGNKVLDKTVREMLADGWQPFGSPTADSSAPGYRYIWQAFVKYETPKAKTS